MTAAQGTDHASLQMLNWDGRFLRERVARHHGMPAEPGTDDASHNTNQPAAPASSALG